MLIWGPFLELHDIAVAVPWLRHQGQENLSQAPSAASRAYGSRRVGSAAPNRIAKYGGAPRRGVRRSRSIPGQWVILSGEYLADIIIKHDYCIQFLSSACVYIYIHTHVYVLYIYIYIDFISWNIMKSQLIHALEPPVFTSCPCDQGYSTLLWIHHKMKKTRPWLAERSGGKVVGDSRYIHRKHIMDYNGIKI